MTTESTVVAVRGDQVAEDPGQGDAPARRLGEIAALVSAIAAVAGILLGIFGVPSFLRRSELSEFRRALEDEHPAGPAATELDRVLSGMQLIVLRMPCTMV
ncbi:hypothetical protein [Streptomyces atratus]|uniref:hypothetical protein n=1 Tax=Streptomyces atratus TaxID=1893 RepID=UPI001670764C|nr:hypothetical protein [Streptomyces atratus]